MIYSDLYILLLLIYKQEFILLQGIMLTDMRLLVLNYPKYIGFCCLCLAISPYRHHQSKAFWTILFSFLFFKLFATHFWICLTSFAVSFFSIENNYYYFSFHISRTQKYNVQNAIVASRTFRDVIMIDGPLTSKPRSFIPLGSKFFFSF